MTTFTDGPAKGQNLMLRRAPYLLRVCLERDLTGAVVKCDALDQPEDDAGPGEELHAYRLTGRPVPCHIRASGGRGGFYQIGTYEVVPEQPTDAQMRDNAAWTEWCHTPERIADYEALKAKERARE